MYNLEESHDQSRRQFRVPYSHRIADTRDNKVRLNRGSEDRSFGVIYTKSRAGQGKFSKVAESVRVFGVVSYSKKEKDLCRLEFEYESSDRKYDKAYSSIRVNSRPLKRGGIDGSIVDAPSILAGLGTLPAYVTRMIPELKK